MNLKTTFLTLSVLISFRATAQFRYSPATPQAGQIVSFTYTPQNTPLATDTTIEGRYVRYGAPSVMSVSRPTAVTLVRQSNEFVGELYVPKKDVTGTMLLFRNSKQPQRTDLNKGQLYVVPVFDADGRMVPHALAGQASVFTRTHFLYEASSSPNLDWVLQLYNQELQQHPDLYPLYWSDYLATKIRQKKPGYGPTVKTAIESYLDSRPAPTAAELTDAARLYESMGDFPKANALRERMKTLDPTGSLAQKDRAMAVRNETNWNRKKTAYQAFATEFPTSPLLPGLSMVITDGYFKNNDIRGLIAFAEQLPVAQTDVLVLNTIANQLADERRSLPEAEQLVNRAMTVLKTQPKPGNVSGNWETEKQIRQRQLLNTYAKTLEQQGKYAEAYAVYQAFMNPNDVDNSDPRTNERYFSCALRTNHAAEARPLAEAAIQVGKATPRLKTALPRLVCQTTRQHRSQRRYLPDRPRSRPPGRPARRTPRPAHQRTGPGFFDDRSERSHNFVVGPARQSGGIGFLGHLVRAVHCVVSGHATGSNEVSERPERAVSVCLYPRGWPIGACL